VRRASATVSFRPIAIPAATAVDTIAHRFRWPDQQATLVEDQRALSRSASVGCSDIQQLKGVLGQFFHAPLRLVILEGPFSAFEIRPRLKTNIRHFGVEFVHLFHVPIIIIDV
jgi:hypothetical protein